MKNEIHKVVETETSVPGKYEWRVFTQKPFAEFKIDLNQSYENSWLGFLIGYKWEEHTIRFQALTGAEGAVARPNRARLPASGASTSAEGCLSAAGGA